MDLEYQFLVFRREAVLLLTLAYEYDRHLGLFARKSVFEGLQRGHAQTSLLSYGD